MGRAGTGPWPSAEDAAVGEEVGLPPEHVEVQLSPLEASILVPLLSSAPKSVFSHPIHFFGCCLQVVSGSLEEWSKQPIGGYETIQQLPSDQQRKLRRFSASSFVIP